MPRAILITGNSRRHLQNNLKFKKYLEAIEVSDIDMIRCAYLEAVIARNRLARLITKDLSEPLLICYSGHGAKNGLAINEDVILTYKTLCRLLQYHPCAFIVLDCCFSHNFALELDCQSVNTSAIGLISACDVQEKSYYGLVDDIIRHWSSGQIYPDEVLIKGSEELDHDPIQKLVTSWRGQVDVMVYKILEEMLEICDDLADRYDSFTRKRWGAQLDHYFFPLNERKSGS